MPRQMTAKEASALTLETVAWRDRWLAAETTYTVAEGDRTSPWNPPASDDDGFWARLARLAAALLASGEGESRGIAAVEAADDLTRQAAVVRQARRAADDAQAGYLTALRELVQQEGVNALVYAITTTNEYGMPHTTWHCVLAEAERVGDRIVWTTPPTRRTAVGATRQMRRIMDDAYRAILVRERSNR